MPISSIDELNGKLNVQTGNGTDIGVSGWTMVSMYYAGVGRNIYIKFEASYSGTAIQSGWVDIVTGFPQPSRNWFFVRTTSTGVIYKIRINTNGILSISVYGNATSVNVDETFQYPIW